MSAVTGSLSSRPTSIRLLTSFALLTLLLVVSLCTTPLRAFAASNTVVTPNNPDGWQPANVRADATVGITSAQPRGDAPNNLGSLEFTTNTVTSGQDKADYVKYWGVVPGRTLGNISALSYEFYRASTSTTAQHFVPAFRLAYQTSGGQTGYLIWENVYNGGSTSAPVPTDQWLSKDIVGGYFWMRAFGPGRTIEKYDVTLAQWSSGYTYGTSQPLDANTSIVGIEVGVGSGWGGTFRGFVDTVAASFGSDSVTANFEPNPVVVQCTTDCYVDDDTGSDTNGGTSFADAKQHIQAGVNQVSSGGTVHVKDGVYNEAITVGKPLTLEGVQHGVLAKGRSGAEATIRLTTNQTPIAIDASDVTVDGFTFDMSQEHTPWAITALSQASYSNLHIQYNLFTGNPGTGDPNQDAGGAYLRNTTNALILGNFFNQLGSHAIFMAGTSNGAIYRNNDSYRNYNSNISTQDTGPGHQNILIENNRAVEDDMILFNMHTATIRNNTITGGAFSTSRIWLGGGSSTVRISGNAFSSLKSTAVQVFDGGFGYGPNSDITVTGNTINTTVANQVDNYSLIDLRDVNGSNLVDGNKVTLSGSYAAGGSATYAVGVRGSGTGTVTITNNEFDGGNVGSTGTPPSSAVLVRSNSANGALTPSAVITVANNYLKNFSNGVAVYDFVANSYGGLATGVVLTVNQNSITGNSANGVITGANAPALNAERNWWGSNTGPTAASNPGGTGDKATGTVDFDPWLCSGQDTSSATGFQPNPQTSPCTPPAGTLQVTKYNDQNRNGARDIGEPGLSGWAITVKQGATTVASGTTGASGDVSFSNLAVGSYTVCETLQASWVNTDPSNGSGCKTATVTANSTTTVLLGNAARASKLIFSTQPGNGTTTTPLNPQPVVKAVDANGNVDTSFNSPVTLTIGANPGGGTLSGTTTVNAVNGVAAFSGLTINKIGFGYTLVASASGLTSATSSPFNVLDSGQTCSSILDNFNRKDGGLGNNWIGPEGLGGYSIRSNQVQVFGGGPIYWTTSFGSDQYACKKLTKVDTTGEEQSLVLKVQASNNKPDWRNGAIDVNYLAASHTVRVDTFQPGNAGPFDSWRHFTPISVTFNDGDVFAARALADGTVRVYKNGALLGSVDTKGASLAKNNTLTYSGNGNFFVNKGGRVGIWDINVPNAKFDDFGGGTVAP